ncbi:MAG: hypothetical protein ACLQVD_12750 [Capsulimonadaceae bacterium]
MSNPSRLVSSSPKRIEIRDSDSVPRELWLAFLYVPLIVIGIALIISGVSDMVHLGGGLAVGGAAVVGLIILACTIAAIVSTTRAQHLYGFVITPFGIETIHRTTFGRTSTLDAVESLSGVYLDLLGTDIVTVYVQRSGQRCDLFRGHASGSEAVAEAIARMYQWTVYLSTMDWSNHPEGMVPLPTSVLANVSTGAVMPVLEAVPQHPDPPLYACFARGSREFLLKRRGGSYRMPITDVAQFRVVPDEVGTPVTFEHSGRGGTYTVTRYRYATRVEMLTSSDGPLVVARIHHLEDEPTDHPAATRDCQWIAKYFAKWTNRPFVDVGGASTAYRTSGWQA